MGILDSSFNPMTFAHTKMIEETRRMIGAGEMLLMLSGANVDKKIFGADLGQRLAMMKAFASTESDLSVAGCSHARFIDKAIALRPLYPDATSFFFILGFDTLQRLFDPKYYDDMESDLSELFSLCSIVSANRDRNSQGEMQEFMKRPECKPYSHRVHFINLSETYASMSSSHVRKRIQRNLSVQDLVPKPIEEAIRSFGIYQD